MLGHFARHAMAPVTLHIVHRHEAVAIISMQASNLCGVSGLVWTSDRTVATITTLDDSPVTVPTYIAMMQYCKTKELPPDSSTRQLLNIAMLSYRRTVPGCADAALAVIVGRMESSGGRRSLNFQTAIFMAPLMSGTPPALLTAKRASVAHLQAVLAGMVETPLTQDHINVLDSLHMTYAETLCVALFTPKRHSPAYNQLLPHLTVPALMHLLKGTFTARSEASVVMLVHAWFGYPPGLATTPQQRRDITASLRLGQLPRGLSHSIRALPWISLTTFQSLEMALFATLTPNEQTSCGPVHPGTDWGMPARTVWKHEDIERMTWVLPRASLPIVRGVHVLGPRMFINGFLVQLKLVTPLSRLGCLLCVKLMYPLPEATPRVTSCTVKVKVMGMDTDTEKHIAQNGWSEVVTLLPGNVEAIGCWDRYIRDDKVHLIVDVGDCK